MRTVDTLTAITQHGTVCPRRFSTSCRPRREHHGGYMADVMKAIRFAWSLYRVRVETAYAGYLRRDPVSLLGLRPGRLDPYPVYEQIRAKGTMVPTRRGNWVSPSHRVC